MISTISVITGATAGIGRALAFTLAEQGHSLALCARTQEDLQILKAELNDQYPQIRVYVESVDVRNKDQIIDFFKSIEEEFGKVDLLVNNAGIFIPGSLFTEDEENLPKMIETNLYSAYYASRQALPLLKKGAGKKHIINICSIASITAYPNGGSYAISKWAMLGMSKGMRAELKDTNIRVTAILPGATWSRSWDGAELPEQRLMNAQSIAEAVISAWKMPANTTVEEIVIRPQKGDL